MIEPVPYHDPKDDSGSENRPRHEPVMVEDLVALVRLPALFEKLDRVLAMVRSAQVLPEGYPMQLSSEKPADGKLHYGLVWRDDQSGLELFAGLSWGDAGHDPAWEVRVQSSPGLDLAPLRARGLHRLAAKRAESRFSEWDHFWHEDTIDERYLVGASAACTRFLEEEHPDRTATEYLIGALHALHASGALHALIQAARESRAG